MSVSMVLEEMLDENSMRLRYVGHSDVMTTCLACDSHAAYELRPFSTARDVSQQGRICEIRPFTVTHCFVSNMEKGLQNRLFLNYKTMV
jgi:hypothetical protein